MSESLEFKDGEEKMSCGGKAGVLFEPSIETKANVAMIRAIVGLILTGIVGIGVIIGILIGWVLF